MYYVKIPLKYLVNNECFDRHKESVLRSLKNGFIPGWATNDDDLQNLIIEEE